MRRRFLRKVGQDYSSETANMTASQSVPVYADTLTGEFFDNLEWGTSASNVYLCYEESGNHATSLSQSNFYYVIAEIDNAKYALGSYDGNVTTTPYSAGMNLNSNNYRWAISYNSSGYNLKNIGDNQYAYVTSDGTFRMSTDEPVQYFTITSGLLAYAYNQGDTWIAYRMSSAIGLIKTTSYTAKLYTITNSGRTITLTPISDSSGTIAGSNRVLILKDSSNYRYIVGANGSSFVMTSISPRQSDDNVTMTFSNSTIYRYMSRYKLTVSGSNGTYSIKFDNASKYLTAPTGNITTSSRFSLESSSSTVSYNDTYGIYLINGYKAGPFGITEIAQGFTTLAYNNDLTAGGTAILYENNSGVWSANYGTVSTDKQHAIVVKGTDADDKYCLLYKDWSHTWASTGHTYISNGVITSNDHTIYSDVVQTSLTTGYSLTWGNYYLILAGDKLTTTSDAPTEYWTIVDGELVWNYSVTTTTTDDSGTETSTTTWYTKTFGVTASSPRLSCHQYSALADVVIDSDCAFTIANGTNGFTISWGGYGLNINNSHLALLAVSLEWEYIPSATPENSRLWSVTSQTTTYYPDYSNSDLEADTEATDTDCQCYLVQNGKIQTYADELVNGSVYALVFISGDNHYLACVSGTDIVPVLYEKLPTSLTSAYYFTAVTNGNGFYLTNGNVKLGINNLKLSMGNYDCTWTYTDE